MVASRLKREHKPHSIDQTTAYLDLQVTIPPALCASDTNSYTYQTLSGAWPIWRGLHTSPGGLRSCNSSEAGNISGEMKSVQRKQAEKGEQA